MKTKLLLILALLFSSFSFAQKLHKMAPKIIAIGLGEKNPYFNESLFPNLEFYYTPTLKVDYGPENIADSDTNLIVNTIYRLKDITYSGTPEYIPVVSKKHDPTQMFLLFDKKGLCYTTGYKLENLNDMGNRKCENNKLLSDNLIKVVKRGKVAKTARKPFVLGKINSIIGNKIDNFPVQNLNGITLELNTLMGKEATLVVFFNLPSTIDIRTLSKAEMKLLDRKESKNVKAMIAVGERSTNILRELEQQFFKTKFK